MKNLFHRFSIKNLLMKDVICRKDGYSSIYNVIIMVFYVTCVFILILLYAVFTLVNVYVDLMVFTRIAGTS